MLIWVGTLAAIASAGKNRENKNDELKIFYEKYFMRSIL